MKASFNHRENFFIEHLTLEQSAQRQGANKKVEKYDQRSGEKQQVRF